MRNNHTFDKQASHVAVAFLATTLAFYGMKDYQAFHGVVEVFGIVVAFCIFIIVWNIRSFQEDGYLLFTGIFFFFSAVIGLIHFLSYKDMLFVSWSDWNKSLQTSVARGFMQGISFAVSPFMLDRKIRVHETMAIYSAMALLALASIFWWGIFPDCYVPGTGSTLFRDASEAIIIFLYAATVPLLLWKKTKLNGNVLRQVVLSVVFLALSELVSAFFPEAAGAVGITGRFLSLAGYYCMYRAVIEIGLTNPFALLFRNVRKGEVELKKEHDFISAVVDTAGVLVMVLDREGAIIRFNKACETASGYVASEATGRKMTDLLLGPEEAVLFADFISRPQRHYLPKFMETWFVTRTGNKRLVSWTYALITGDRPEEAHVVLTGIDVTQRRTAEEEMKLSAERYRSLYNNTPVMLHSLDSECRIVNVSKYWLDSMGYKRTEVIGKRFAEFLAPASRNHVDECISGEFLVKGLCRDLSCRVERKDGAKMDVLLSLVAERDNVGGFTRTLAVMVDVTERKRYQKEIEDLNRDLAMRAGEIEDANRQLEKLNTGLEEMLREEVAMSRKKDFLMIQQSRQAAMGEMIANIAHQWRQPLNAIGLCVQDLEECFEHGELTREYLEGGVAQAMDIISHMSQTINDFRNFFKPDKEIVRFRVKDVIQRVLNFVSHGFRDSGVLIDLEIVDDVCVDGLPNEYSQVILNIINNARDALVERKVAAPAVRIRVYGAGDRSVVMISDNAGGIPEAIIGSIFDPYFTTKGAGGTGIGLYISKTIIEQNMKGALTVRNSGEGAEFSIEV